MVLGKFFKKDIKKMYPPTKPTEPKLTKMVYIKSEINYGDYINLKDLIKENATHLLLKHDGSYSDFYLQYYREESLPEKMIEKLKKQYEKDLKVYEENLKKYNNSLEETKKKQEEIQKDKEYKTYLKLKAKYDKSGKNN